MILQTERLIIRKFKPADLAALINLFADPEVMRYIGPRRAMTEDETQKWLTDILLQQEICSPDMLWHYEKQMN